MQRFLNTPACFKKTRRSVIGTTIAAAVGLGFGLGAPAQATTTINFTLGAAYTTSGGVFKTDGTLVRTLWRKVAYSSGLHTVTWDDKDDNGTTVGAGTYQVRVLYHNVTYTWEGTIGNTASSFTGFIRRGLGQMSDFAADGTNVFTAMGYNENQSGLERFTSSTPQTTTDALPKCITTALTYVATDGTWYYTANNCGIDFGLDQTFVTAYKVSDNTQATFTNGVGICQQFNGSTCYPEHYFPSVIDNEAKSAGHFSSGLAVQKTGTVLAVAHGSLNLIRLYHKTVGNLTGSISVTNPGRIAFAPNGDLWVLTGTSAERFAAGTLGTTNTPVTTISGFTSPLAIAVHPTDNNVVMVADGGTSQQVKAYNSTGTSLWTYGTAGGYASDATVSTSKLSFLPGQTYIAILSDGSFWVGDGNNDRALHFTSARAYVEQIMYLPADYVATSDPNTPSRVIGHNWLEFQVDYTKPLLPGDPYATGGNNSWKLVKNWGLSVASQFAGTGVGKGITTVNTLSGHVYGLVNDSSNGMQAVVELPASGNLRFTGIEVPGSATLYSNGDLRNYSIAAGIQTVTKQALTGIDGSNNPIWGTATTLASSSAGATDPSYHGYFSGGSGPRFPVSSANVMISFDQGVGGGANTGMHLGGVTVGASQWLWKASPAATTVNYNDPAQCIGTFDIGDGTNYGGNLVLASGHNVVYGYHGEFWSGGEANQFMHFWDDGLFVGEFGKPNNPGITDAEVGVSGNAMTPSLVTVSGVTYMWVDDESNHDGVHRWRLDNVSGIAEITGSGALDSTITVGGSAPPAPTGLTATPGNTQITLNWGASSGATSYNVYRGTTSGGESTTAIYTGIAGTSKIDTGLTNGTHYYYKVKAVNGAGTSGYSNEANAIPLAPPAAPTNLIATPGITQVSLSWTASSGATSYNVYRGTTAGGESGTAIATGIAVTSYKNTGLTNGTHYYYTVKAVNGGGTSGASAEASATPGAGTGNASIFHATSVPTIDGNVDTIWNSATSYNIAKIVQGASSDTGTWKAMWDSSKIYVLVTVADSSLLNGTTDYNGDSVEFYVDANDRKGTTYDARDFQYILGWGHATLSEYAHGATAGVSFAQVNITGGYRMEFAIPWTVLGVTPQSNSFLGFDAGIDDALNTTTRAGQLMWFGTSNNYIDPSQFGTGTLAP